MNKKGFTLIELLAVIVILAIIALIATPIVVTLMDKSEAAAAERSAENYIKAVDIAIGTERLDGKRLEGDYDILENGNLCPANTTCTDATDIEIDMNGQKPSSGTINIKEGVVTIKTTMQIGDYIVSQSSNGKIVATKIEEENDEETDNGGVNKPTVTKLCTYVVGQEKASKTVGAEYTCHLDTDRTFYVLENIESSDNISLIMDRNFTDDTVAKTLAWCIDGGSNNTCKNINSKEDNPLKHIQDTFGNNVEVSFPTKDQITSANNGRDSNLPQWLYDHLNGTPNPESGVYGYWTASTSAGGACYAWAVSSRGYMVSNDVGSSGGGVRPVITISKEQLN